MTHQAHCKLSPNSLKKTHEIPNVWMQICCVTYVHTLTFVLIDCTVKKTWLNIKQRWAGPDVLQLKLCHDRFHVCFMMSVKQFELRASWPKTMSNCASDSEYWLILNSISIPTTIIKIVLFYYMIVYSLYIQYECVLSWVCVWCVRLH